MRARRHITSIASNKVPGHPLEILDFVSGSGSYIATGRALRSGKRSSQGSTKIQKSLQALIHLGLNHFRIFEKHFKKRNDHITSHKQKNKKFNNEMWLNLVERYVRDVEVVGSNPVISTKNKR